MISKWKSRLHGRSFGSDRYSEYFPQPGFFHIVAFTPFSTTMCGIYYHIGLQNTTHKEYFVQNIHEITFIFFRISISRKSKKRIIWKEYLRRIAAQFLIRKRFMMMTSLNLLKLRGENLWTCNISEFKLHSQGQFYCCDFWGSEYFIHQHTICVAGRLLPPNWSFESWILWISALTWILWIFQIFWTQ